MDVDFRRRRSNGITLHCAEAGPVDGPLVLLLHGFPEFWYGWRHQIAPLARAGYRIVAPDQRGYGESDKPKGVAAYDLDVLAADVTGLADDLGRQRFAIVGHDWGASVGWWVARNYGKRVERLVILNAPHPAVWKHAMRHNPAQKKLSRYVEAIRWPLVPELLIRSGGYRSLVEVLRGAKPADAFTDADIAKCLTAWKRPGAMTAMLNWYRALLRKPMPLADEPQLAMPVRIIWGGRQLRASGARMRERKALPRCQDSLHRERHPLGPA